MPTTVTTYKLYRDRDGKLRKTKSGHYRFDMITTNEDGSPHSTILGFRLDYERKRILPVTVTVGGNLLTVAEVAPEEHGRLVGKLVDTIAKELEEERISSVNGY